jgi:hypothetical protein
MCELCLQLDDREKWEYSKHRLQMQRWIQGR